MDMTNMNLDDEWLSFLEDKPAHALEVVKSGTAPTPTALYVSTNTIISFLNQAIDLVPTFWSIPIISYSDYAQGVIKKQMKFINTCPEEVDVIDAHLKTYEFSTVSILFKNNDKNASKFKDVRKVTVGVSKKDILSYRIKNKGAFYNCFAIIIRILIQGTFKEFHMKIFNTGKIEIPGIQTSDHIPIIIDYLLGLLRPSYPTIVYNKFCEETVLINSNFNCGFYIKRYELYNVLKSKYNISAVYDPCSYPGIQCKVYYHGQIYTTVQSMSVSFMIFRTGSILIVGKCSEKILYEIYDYLVNILSMEYNLIREEMDVFHKKNTLQRKNKRFILIS